MRKTIRKFYIIWIISILSSAQITSGISCFSVDSFLGFILESIFESPFVSDFNGNIDFCSSSYSPKSSEYNLWSEKSVYSSYVTLKTNPASSPVMIEMTMVTPKYANWYPACSYAGSFLSPKAWKVKPSSELKVKCRIMIQGKTINPPMKHMIKIGIIKPWLSTISFLFQLLTAVFIKIEVKNPATKPSARDAPIFYIKPAAAPVITPPITHPTEASIIPTLPLFMAIDPPYVPMTPPTIENHIFAGPTLNLKVCPVPVSEMISVVMRAKVQKRKAVPRKYQTMDASSVFIFFYFLGFVLLRAQTINPNMAPKKKTKYVP